MYKRFFSVLLCFMMLLTIALPVHADETEPQEEPIFTELKITTADEFLEFAENCRLDSYSRNLKVSLEADIDLSGVEFSCVPIFSGSFDGNGHTISGLSITADGSVQGLFRYLTATAVVQNLSVNGEIHPGGSGNEVGAIAGENEGKILNCSFSGSLSGCDYAGGLVGINTVTGIIENCRADGEIHGDHFVGGIAGENNGVIRDCTNNAQINTTPQQNSVEISDITMSTLTNTEAANTVTDIGGIAGSSSGVIRESVNHGNVGYQHMGYNIGGIAGTQSGYIVDCENHGDVQGRKEVGGIVGQMEPASLIEYSEDTLQILQGQLGTMSGLVNQASSNAQTNAGQISGQIGVLQDQAQTARDAVDTLFPDAENPELPDPDTILAAQNTLSTTINAMPATLQNIASATQSTVNGLTRDLNAISGQISAMGQTINGAPENLGGSITDVSDQDTPDALTGKVENCINYANVLADLNAGGIAGAMATENDLDILEDWEQYGEESLNFQSEVRAVILSGENHGTITGKKQNVGGIVGWQSMGLVKNSTNTGKVDGADADYVGGISGLSTGFIRSGYAKCEIYGESYVGGIAGSATIVTDSLSQVKLVDGKEKLGAILGFAEESNSDEEEPVSGNFYLPVDADLGAIDGISYSGLAESMELDVFLGIENLPSVFQTVTIRFVFENGRIVDIPVAPGEELHASKIPEVPEKEGYTGVWDGLENTDLSSILFDMTFEAVYTAYSRAIESEQTRDNGLPIVLLEGSFTDKATVSVAASDAAPVLTGKEVLLESWSVHMSENGSAAHFLLPDGTDAGSLKLYLCNSDGQWREASFSQDGSYLVFSIGPGDTGFAIADDRDSGYALYAAVIVILAAVIMAAAVLIRKKRKRAPVEDTASPGEGHNT